MLWSDILLELFLAWESYCTETLHKLNKALLNCLLLAVHWANCKVTQLLWLQEGNINDSHFCFVTIQLTKSKQLVQLSPMSCFHQSGVIENC